MIGYDINSRGRYKCHFCNHATYKTLSGILHHIEREHPKDLENEELKDRINKLQVQPPRIIEKEKIVYRDAPKPKEVKYWYIKNGGGIYCETCKVVEMRVGIPEGQTIESTPHSCGNRTLKLVLEVR